MQAKLFYAEIYQKAAHSQQHVKAFMLMGTKTDVLQMLNSETIIDSVAEKSKVLQELLM